MKKDSTGGTVPTATFFLSLSEIIGSADTSVENENEENKNTSNTKKLKILLLCITTKIPPDINS